MDIKGIVLAPESNIEQIMQSYQTNPMKDTPIDLCSTHPKWTSLLDMVSHEDVIGKLYKIYPPLEMILKKYQGKVAVCGGVLCRIIMEVLRVVGIVTSFFYGCEEINEEVLREYRDMLEDCVAVIADFYGKEVFVRDLIMW